MSKKIKAKVKVLKWAGKVVKTYALQENTHWSTYTYLTPIILDALKQFREHKKLGCPFFCLPKWYIGDADQKLSKKQWAKAYAKWDRYVDEAILAFELMVQDEEPSPEPFDKAKHEERQRQIKRGLKRFALIYRGLWD